MSESATTSSHLRDISLPWLLRLLYAVGGASMQLPSLALLSIVNDRAAIPPAYLPAYGAIAFLPWSLKPIYAVVSSKIVGHTHRTYRLRLLLAALLALNGLTYIGTNMFVPMNGIVPCFVWGFLRGLTSSWPDFLLGLTLIETAQQATCRSSTYEDCASVFQAQAATARNTGSLLASMAAFVLFLVRHFQLVETQLSSAVVSSLLFGTAVLNLGGSALTVAINCGVTIKGNNSEFSRQEQRTKRQGGSNENGAYQTIGSQEAQEFTPMVGALEDPLETVEPITTAVSPSMNFARICDMTSLVLFQALLMLSALRRPIVSVATTGIWNTLIVLSGVGLIATLIISSCVSKPQQDIPGKLAQRGVKASKIPPKRLALFLMVRHTVPIAGMLMYSYIYAIFAAEPLFLQILSIVESTISIVASWTYERWFAKTCHSGWKMIGLVAVLTVVTGLVSLMDVIVVHATTVGGAVTPQIRWLVLLVVICKYFMGHLNYMPMTVLATTNVVSSSNVEGRREPSDEQDKSDGSLGNREGTEIEMTLIVAESRSFEETEQSPVYDESIQYASYLSCIYFGTQVGDWIAVPIIAALGITRENDWNNLELFICICALGRIASVALLWLIRPAPTA
jgi:hypothetical protein